MVEQKKTIYLQKDKMRILIDTGHPAHVHLFRPFALYMQKQGHNVLFTARDKECTIELLKHYDFDYKVFGKNYKSIFGKLFGLLRYNVLMFRVIKNFKPDITLSHSSFYLSQASYLFRKVKNITFEDTFNFEQVVLYKPFADVILTGDFPHPVISTKKEQNYRGYHELAYLHPNQFSADSEIFSRLGIAEGSKYSLLRFVSWTASHDRGHSGISIENKREAVEKFLKYGDVFISTEQPLPPDLELYKLNLPASEMHNVIASASLVYGESATMASEAACLGVPAIYHDNKGRYYTTELEEKYGLVFNFSELEEDQEKAIEKGVEILNQQPSDIWEKKRDVMLTDKEDVTAFLISFVKQFEK